MACQIPTAPVTLDMAAVYALEAQARQTGRCGSSDQTDHSVNLQLEITFSM